MSNDPKQTPAKPRPVPPHVELKCRTFPVDYIKSIPGVDFDVPGKIGSSITTSRERPDNRTYHLVEFVPDFESFAVTFVRPLEGNATVYIPARNVRSWAPLL